MRFLERFRTGAHKLENRFKRGLASSHRFVGKGEGLLKGVHRRASNLVDSLERNKLIDAEEAKKGREFLEKADRGVKFVGDLKDNLKPNLDKSSRGMKSAVMPQQGENQ